MNRLLHPRKLSESRCFYIPLLSLKKLNLSLKAKVAMLIAQRINLTFVPYSFVANFVSYISAKYCLNWFSFHIVIMKVIWVNFFETQCSTGISFSPVRSTNRNTATVPLFGVIANRFACRSDYNIIISVCRFRLHLWSCALWLKLKTWLEHFVRVSYWILPLAK